MILKKNEQGVVVLNGEPVHEWFRKRGITPCEMRYAEVEAEKCTMCLLGALGYAATENVKTLSEYVEEVRKELSPVRYVAYLTGETTQDIQRLELGYLSRSDEPRTNEMRVLGYEAKLQLFNEFGKIDTR